MLDDAGHNQCAGPEARQLVLRRLDVLYEEALAAWQKSKEPIVRTRVICDPMTGAAYEQVQTTEQRLSGDPRLLGQAQQALAALRAVLGLDAPALSATAQVVSITQPQEPARGEVTVDLAPPQALEHGGDPEDLEAEDS
jgi:hypothetical protein